MSDYTSDANSNSKSPERDKVYTRLGQLRSERASWISHWQELSTFLLPRNGRYFIQDRNKGQRRHNNIYDSTGTRALRVLAAGMMSGMTSPARPWFRLQTSDEDLMQYAPVKLWLAQCTALIHRVFQRSNTYRALHSMYEELGTFGTACSIIVPDFDNVIHHHVITTGEYALATDYRGNVNTVYREFQKTVHEVVTEFGYANCSTSTQNLFDRGSLDSWVTIVHAIEPRSDRDHTKLDGVNMEWMSCYFETNAPKGKFLRESGFRKFPALCPRWAVAGGDVYGNSPGMEALGDIKQLQHEQIRKAEGIDYQTKPPLIMPTSMKNRDVDTLPGGVSYYDASTNPQTIRTAFDVNLDLNHLLQDIQDVRERVKGAFYADIFLMLSDANDSRLTATEVAERHEEKLLMLGPVLERLQNELLAPLIDVTFDRVMEVGLLPPPPPELHGKQLDVELVSMLAQAQRAIGTNSIDRFVGNIGAVAQFKPEVLDRFDTDAYVDVYADSLGLDPKLVVPLDVANKLRMQRAQQAAQQQQIAQAEQASSAAKNMAQAQQANPNFMGAAGIPGQQPADVTQQFSGYT
jgi:hypothetical protein